MHNIFEIMEYKNSMTLSTNMFFILTYNLVLCVI